MVSSFGPALFTASGLGLTGWPRPDSRSPSPLSLARTLLGAGTRPVAVHADPSGPAPGPRPPQLATDPRGAFVDLRVTQRHTVDEASLTVRTAEGDTITLSSHREQTSLRARLTYAPGDAPASDGGHGDAGAIQMGLRDLQLDERITVSVQGDLSETELADLRTLVGRLGDSLHERDDQGEGPQPLPAADLRGLDSLAAFSLQVEHTEDVTRLHVRRLEPVAAGPPLPAAPQDPTAANGGASRDADPQAASPAWLLRLLETLRVPPSPPEPPRPTPAPLPGPAATTSNLA